MAETFLVEINQNNELLFIIVSSGDSSPNFRSGLLAGFACRQDLDQTWKEGKMTSE